MQLFLLTAVAAVSFFLSNNAHAQAPVRPAPAAVPSAPTTSPALTKSLQAVYLYWRKAMMNKQFPAWKQITAPHRRLSIQNRILSERGKFPLDIFRLPTAPPGLTGLKLLRSRSRGVTAKQVYFGKINFGVGGNPTDNLLVLSFVHAEGGWKYDKAEFINLTALKTVRKQLQGGKLSYVDGADFQPDGKKPRNPIIVPRAKYIAKVYTFCPGREVKATVNRLSHHRFQNITMSEVVIGGAKHGPNTINYTIKDLPGYKGNDPITIRVYLFSQVPGVKPIKVFQYQTVKGQKPKLSGTGTFNVTAATAQKLLGK